MNTAIDVKQLSVTLGNRHILHDINVSVPIGKITTLIGPNGCGKSTLLRSMIGYIHSPYECITIFDKPLQSYSQKHLARQMAFLPQVPNMPKDMTVEELVYCGRYPYLSGGERQRVWIAMALAQQPKLLVLDEPTTYLDINHQLEIMELLKRLNKEQDLTVLMVLHELTQAVQYSHYMAVIKEGHLVTSGETSKIISDELFRDVFSVDVQLDTFDNKKYVRVKGLVE